MDNTPTNLTQGTGANKRLSGEATAFLIWRAAQSVDWDCSMAEIARELGMSANGVYQAAKRKGWLHRFNGEVGRAVHSRTFGQAPDLCAMMGMER